MIHEGVLTSLKRFKDDINEVKEGFECGIGVDGFIDFEEGDVIEVYEIEEKKRKRFEVVRDGGGLFEGLFIKPDSCDFWTHYQNNG